ncbi:MAG: hypothetical protein WAK93_10180 [Solirubrobacteraceae bacterium]
MGPGKRRIGRGGGLLLAVLLGLGLWAGAVASAGARSGPKASPSFSLPPITLPLGGQSGPTPIPSVNVPASPSYLGAPAVPHRIRGVGAVPHNRFMAANGDSEIHDDGWQSDIYRWGGPLGRAPQTFSNYLAVSGSPSAGRDCGSTTFDSRGRVVSICISNTGPELYMFDPGTLATLATFSLPPRTAEDLLLNPNFFQDFSNGGYFYLDNRNQVVTATTNQHIYVIAENAGGAAGFTLAHDYDLSSVLKPDEEINSQLPDSHGLVWFTTRRDGAVGTLNLKTGKVHVIRLGSGADNEITKSLATDAHGGVYIPTDEKLYRFVAGRGGVPRISWQIAYPNDGVSKPGQLDAGTGTTPVISGRYVGINDNADPMDVMIYRTAGHLRRHQRRTVCRMPVFSKGSSADENAMIAAGRSYLIENNYGYQTPASVEGGQVTAPGFARVDINRNGRGCHRVWTNTKVSAPTVVSKLSLANGLIYTYTTTSSASSPWYWTAIDYRTGRVAYQQLAGNGPYFNNNYSGLAISRKGTAYLGTLGGIIGLRDGS